MRRLGYANLAIVIVLASRGSWIQADVGTKMMEAKDTDMRKCPGCGKEVIMSEMTCECPHCHAMMKHADMLTCPKCDGMMASSGMCCGHCRMAKKD